MRQFIIAILFSEKRILATVHDTTLALQASESRKVLVLYSLVLDTVDGNSNPINTFRLKGFEKAEARFT